MNNIYSRPMFQNPQQRAGGGIMAGVAPVNMSEGGGFFSFDETPEGSGVNLKDVQKFLFDPTDPIDQASLALALVPGANVLARLTAMGLKGARLYRQIRKVEKFRDATNNKIKKVEQFKDATTKPAALAGTVSGTLQAGDFAVDMAQDPQVRQDISSIARDIPEIVSQEIDRIRNPEKYEESLDSKVYDQTVPSYGDDYIDDIENAASGDFTSSPQYDEGGISSLRSDQDAVGGGIADVARNISEAREMKSSTFRRGDEDLAAVTAEDLEESGFDSLTDYLNNMEFNSDSGRYAPQEMANGGIMRLKDGSDKEGVVVEKDIQDFLDSYKELDIDKFLSLTDEEQQIYLDAYKEKLEYNERSRSRRARSPISQVNALIGDAANYIPETATNIYRNIKYGDIGKAAGFSTPLDERPTGEGTFSVDVDDPSFYQELNTPNLNTDPLAERNREDIVNSLRPPEPPKALQEIETEEDNPTQEIVETTEERPGFIETAYGAVKDYYGMGGTSENEKNAQRVANNTRIPLGSSWQAVYNEALSQLELQDAKVLESRALIDSRSRSDMQQEFEFLESRFPGLSDEELMDKYTLFKRSNSRTGAITASGLFEARQKASEHMNENWNTIYEKEFTDNNAKLRALGQPDLSKTEYIKTMAIKLTNDLLEGEANTSAPSSSTNSSKLKVTARTP